jgi:tRNA G18 (ribose-2'-O)-methylase SpoU
MSMVLLVSTKMVTPPYYLVITNISKRNNVKSLIQTSIAFGCFGVFVVGQPQFDFSDHATAINLRHFHKWKEFVHFLHEEAITLIGVEIHENAVDIQDYRVSGEPVAFLMGNEGQGILPKHMKDCNGFVKICQYGSGTASLNVNVAASIILHRYQIKVTEDIGEH